MLLGRHVELLSGLFVHCLHRAIFKQYEAIYIILSHFKHRLGNEQMAHSSDVFDTAGTHACSCHSNGGLARTIIKCIVKLTSVLLNPVFFCFRWF